MCVCACVCVCVCVCVCLYLIEMCACVLGGDFTESQGAPDVPAFRLVDMYMNCTEEVVKEEIIHKIRSCVLWPPQLLLVQGSLFWS